MDDSETEVDEYWEAMQEVYISSEQENPEGEGEAAEKKEDEEKVFNFFDKTIYALMFQVKGEVNDADI